MNRASCFKLLIAIVLVCCISLLYYSNINYHLHVVVSSSTDVSGPPQKLRLIQGESSQYENHGMSNFDIINDNSNLDLQKKHFTDVTNHYTLTNVLPGNRNTTATISSLTTGENLPFRIPDSNSNSSSYGKRQSSTNNFNRIDTATALTDVQASHVVTKRKILIPVGDTNSWNGSVTRSLSNTLESATNVPSEASSEDDIVYTNNTKSFLLDGSFTSPWPSSRSVESIQKEAWFKELATFLDNSVPRLPIVLVSSDSDFQDALLNWLISALLRQNDPVSNILVLTYRPSLCVFINSKKIVNCVSILPGTLTDDSIFMHERYKGMYRLLVIRVFVMRLLTYWGYDVANFDTDAILLKSPIPVLLSQEFSNSDVIGTFGGTLPGALHNKWGVVLCMGAIFMRSTSHTELLWESMRRVKQRDDQIKMNYGLDNLHVRWTTRNFNQTDRQDDLSKLWEGEAEGGLRVTLLPQRMACRLSGCRQDLKHGCYIWHRGRNQHKSNKMIGHAKNDGVWFLREDWHSVPSYYTGKNWLRAIATPLV